MEVRFIAIIVYAILSSRPLGAVASVSTITSVPVRYLHQFYSGVSHLASGWCCISIRSCSIVHGRQRTSALDPQKYFAKWVNGSAVIACGV